MIANIKPELLAAIERRDISTSFGYCGCTAHERQLIADRSALLEEVRVLQHQKARLERERAQLLNTLPSCG